MMKLLVVDDEDFTRKCISEQIDWGAYDLEVVGTAVDGNDAWEKICVLRPDFVIIDIKMPNMNGLELLEKIKNAGLDTEAVILSGFDEFEYAQKALNLGAKSYLLKPVDLSELLNAVITLQEKKIQEKEKSADEDGLEKFIRNLIYMEYTPEKLAEINEKAAEVWEYYQTVILLQMENIREAFYVGTASVYKMLLEKMQVHCRESQECCLLEKSPQNIMLYVLAGSREDAEKAVADTVNLMERTLCEAGYKDFAVGVSTVNHTIEESGKSYMEAIRAINMKFIYGSGKVYYAGEEQPSAYTETSASGRLIREIVENTVYYNEDSVDLLIHRFFEESERQKTATEYIRQAAYLVLMGLIRHEALVNIDMNSLYSDTGAVIMAFGNCEDVIEMQRKLKSFLHTIGRQLNEVKIKKPNQTAMQIEQYIKEHYRQPDLSLSRIAEEFNFSAAYLSTLFKNSCDQNITDYINTVRIEEACTLLRGGQHKVASISESVGYSNTTYFNKVFKKLKGCSPKDYRNGRKE